MVPTGLQYEGNLLTTVYRENFMNVNDFYPGMDLMWEMVGRVNYDDCKISYIFGEDHMIFAVMIYTEYDKHTIVNLLCVAESFRRKGYGTLLLSALAEVLSGNHKLGSLTLSCTDESRPFYERLGFKTVTGDRMEFNAEAATDAQLERLHARRPSTDNPKWHPERYRLNRCGGCSWAGTGYCPIHTNIGCVMHDGYCYLSAEEFEATHGFMPKEADNA